MTDEDARNASTDDRTDGSSERNDRQPTTLSRRRLLQTSGAVALAGGLAGYTPVRGAATEASGHGGETVPVLNVRPRGLGEQQAAAFTGELGVEEARVDEKGVLQYVDEEAYMPIPSADVDPRADAGEERTGQRDASMAVDLDALAERPEPPSPDLVEGLFMQAAETAEALPSGPLEFSTTTSHATLEVADAAEGRTELERRLDTAVYVMASYRGVPLEGPGAKIRGRASTVAGGPAWADVRHSFRQEVEAGPDVDLVPPDAVKERYREVLERTTDVEVVELADPRLVYRAPALGRANDTPIGEGSYEAGTLVPHYSVGGRVLIEGPRGEPQEVELLREYVPATSDADYVPSVEMEAFAEGGQVEASVSITGGQSPYRVDWSLSDGTLSLDPTRAGDPAQISTTITAREPVDETTLTVEVTDANGVSVSDRQRLTVEVEPRAALGTARDLAAARAAAGVSAVPGYASPGPAADPAAVDIGTGTGTDEGQHAAGALVTSYDVGLEAAIWPSWASGFLRAARIAGVTRHNTWKGSTVWERDFKSPSDDRYGVDTADLVFTTGHGMPLGWTVENTAHDDKWIWHTNADGDWGDHDCEWHALLSCNVLAPDDGKCGRCRGKSRVDRWGQEFDGLHQFQGFQTLGWRVPGFPDAYGRYVFGNWLFGSLKMRTAWFLAVDNYQPAYDPNQAWKRRGVVMFPIDEHGRCTKDDYFHGEGPVGPDIPQEDVRWICSIVAGVGGG